MPDPRDPRDLPYPNRLLPGDLATSRSDIDPEEFGRLLGDLAHASTTKLQPPKQPTFPRLASGRTGGSVPTTVEEATAGAKRQDESYAAKLLASPVTGGQRVYRGASTLMQQAPPDVPLTREDTPLTGRELARAGSDILGGGMEAGTILLPEALAAHPWSVGTGLLTGTAAGTATHAAGEKLGLPPEYTDLASEVAGLATGIGTGHAFRSPAARAALVSEGQRAFADQRGQIGQLGPRETVGAPPPAPEEGRGLYSRIDDMVDRQLAGKNVKQVHPSKILDMLKKGADADEVSWRNLLRFIESYGNSPIPVESLKQHLAQNPAPFPNQITLGEAGPRERPPSFEQWLFDKEIDWNDIHQGRRDGLRAQYAREMEGQARYRPALRNTENARWQLQGGDNYRERLFQLRQKPTDQGLLRAEVRRHDGSVAWAGNDLTPEQARQMGETYNDPGRYSLHVEPSPPSQPKGFLSHVYQHTPDLIGWTRYNERNLSHPIEAQRNALQEQMAQKIAEMQDLPRDVSFRNPEEYRASPIGQAHQRLMTEHNALNDQLRALPGHIRSLPEIEAIIQDVVGAKRPEHIASGGPSAAVRQGLITHDEANAYGSSRGFHGYAPPEPQVGDLVRHIEENQSDLHQRGEDEGYASRPPDFHEQLAKIMGERAQASDAFDQAVKAKEAVDAAHQQLQSRLTRTRLPPEWQHLESFDQALKEVSGSYSRVPVEAWRAAREAVQTHPDIIASHARGREAGDVYDTAAQRVRAARDAETALTAPKGVPDMPFKRNWEDLFLKQHLLDVAKDPRIEGLSLSSGRTQNERYNLANYVSKLEYDPQHGYLSGWGVEDPQSIVYNERVPLEELQQHIGKGPAEELRRKIAQHEASKAYDRSQWSVGHDTDNPKYFHIYDPNGEPLHTYDGALEHFRSEEAANARIDDLLFQDSHASGRELPNLSGPDLRIGGQGMDEAYDRRQRRRLEKLLAPHGGRVEPTTLPVPAGGSAGPSHARDEPAWLARLTPEIKASILKHGFPLAALLLAIQQGNIGAPPPPMPSHERQD